MSSYDVKKVVGKNLPQSTRRIEIKKTLDFAEIAKSTASDLGLAAADDASVFDLPGGFVFERMDAISRTAEGEACTFDVGDAADPDGFGVDLSANVAAGSQISVGSPAYAGAKYFAAATTVLVTVNAAQPALNVAKIDLIFVGYMAD